MRPYRAIPTDGKDFIYGWYKEDTYGKPKILAENPQNHFLCWFFVIPETVGQSTGWTALMGGKEIYTDDIIEFNVAEGFGSDKRFKGKVYFDSSRLSYCVDARPAWNFLVAHNLKMIKVIGNIHQTPELLEKQ